MLLIDKTKSTDIRTHTSQQGPINDSGTSFVKALCMLDGTIYHTVTLQIKPETYFGFITDSKFKAN